MTIHENLTTFGGKPVIDFKRPGDIADFAAVAPRVRCEYDDKETLVDFLSVLIDQPGAAATTALVLGLWMENGEAYEVTPARAIELLVAMKDRLPNLEALFVGDIISEENEISWITQGDLAPIWAAFPGLREVGIRGGNELRLGRVVHGGLRKLVVQTGGLPKAVLRDALEIDAPIDHLELWFGIEDYGGDTAIADLEPLMAGGLFPKLATLGLCNSDYSDDIAARLATSPLLDRISALDLSKGTLTDKGAQALIASGRLGTLERLDISFHYVSPAVVAELARATPKLIADDPQTPDDWDGAPHYYVAVSE
ncbi:STM4015 family protein [Sphingomonas colocasiae]|uniref:STM4015 family protein n=1 Tax=Sphingomonas colocasiae TaxID=1848973 RepID=A0ABS7PUV6_9SPHN|nr:STM4015 family protein [Sphingomonas colocasiae]MBY8825140.1 STM4015 family protein [Sphingomonas colocasiae]